MLSGLIGAGAQDGLEELLVRQLKEQMAQEEIRQAKARESFQREGLAFDKQRHGDTVKLRSRELDNQDAARRQRANEAGVADMLAQGEIMDKREASAALQRELDALMGDTDIPEPVKRAARLKRVGVTAQPDDLLNEKEQSAASDRKVRDAIRIAQGSRAPEKPQGPAGKVIKEIGPDGKPRERWASPEELIKGVPIADTAPTKPVTGMERNVLGFYIRAKDAEETVAPLEDEIAKMPVTSQAWMEYAPNFLQSQTGQSYRQAQRAFTEARLRKESGAAVPQSEYDNDARTYFAQPGDTAQTIAQKRQKRGVVLRSLATASGRAYDEHFGTPMDGGEAGNVMTKEQVNQKTGARRTLVSTDGGKTWQVKQ